MSKFSVEQRRITHRGTVFHFVSYDGHPGNPKRGQPATGPAWYLMREGRRWEVMPHHPSQDDAELDRSLTSWLDEHVFGGEPPPSND